MKNVSRVNVLEPSEDLIEKVASVVIAQMLGFKQLVEVSLH